MEFNRQKMRGLRLASLAVLKSAPSGTAAPASSPSYADSTVAELKDMLRSRKLPVSGRKADLVERLVKFETGSSHSPTTSLKDQLSSALPPQSVYVSACKS